MSVSQILCHGRPVRWGIPCWVLRIARRGQAVELCGSSYLHLGTFSSSDDLKIHETKYSPATVQHSVTAVQGSQLPAAHRHTGRYRLTSPSAINLTLNVQRSRHGRDMWLPSLSTFSCYCRCRVLPSLAACFFQVRYSEGGESRGSA